MADPFIILEYFIAVIKYGWPFFILFTLIGAKLKWKNWPIDVVIIERRGDNLIKTNDRAGWYLDKFTGLKGYKLLTTKETMPAIQYSWILHNSPKPTNILERIVNIIRPNVGTLFLFKYGTNQYKPLEIKDNLNIPKQKITTNNKKGEPVIIDVYQQFDPRGSLETLDFEVVDWDNMNFMVQEMRASLERRKKKGDWLKQALVPLAMLAVAAMISIIMIKFSMDQAENILKSSNSNPLPVEDATTPNIPIIGDVIPGK